MRQHYAVSIPSSRLSDYEFERLLNIIAHTSTRLKTALGTRNLAVVHLQNQLWFPWFTLKGFYKETDDFYYLVYGLCDLAKECSFSKAYSSQEVQWLLWELDLDVMPMPTLVKFPKFGGHLSIPRWCTHIMRTLSDIRTCFFKRPE